MVREFREYDEHEESLDDDIREKDDIEHLYETESEFGQTLSENDKTIASETSLPLLLNDALRFVPANDDSLLISAVRELAQIRDTATLEMELGKFPHFREKPEFRLMYSTCEKYFKALHYRDALYQSETTFSAIAATLETYPEQIRRWLVLEQQPRLLWLLDHERKRMVVTQTLQKLEHQINASNRLLHTTEDLESRPNFLPPPSFNNESIEKLLSLKRSVIFPPTEFAKITSLQMYELALRAFPLIQEHLHFDTLHRQTKLFFLIRENYPLHSTTSLPIDAIAQHVGVSETTIIDWRNETKRPHLVFLLENWASNLRIHQNRLEKLRDVDNGLNSIQEITRRLNSDHFALGEIIQNHTNFSNYLNDTNRYLVILALVEVGYHPRELEIHFKLPESTVSDILRYQHRPYLVRLAAEIPDNPPAPGLRWLPTVTDTKSVTKRYIQVPPRITRIEQLVPIIKKLQNLHNPDLFLENKLANFGPTKEMLEQWRRQFGSIQTLEEKILALGYLIGASLSDGHIKMTSNINSYFKIGLSKKYTWSKTFGNRVAYYYTSLGIPTSPGNDLPPQKGDPHGAFQWYSCSTPILTWFDQAVLGFKPKETHKENPAKIDWIFNTPQSFQIKVLQGLFDGDGWANIPNRVIGIDSKQNQETIHRLLDRVRIKATKYDTEYLRIETKDDIRNALKLPIFLSATGRLEATNQIVHMNEVPPLTERLCKRPLMMKILTLHEENPDLSPGKISTRIFQEQGIVIGRNAISRLIKKGREGIKIVETTVRTYFSLLERYLEEPNETRYHLLKKIKRATGYKGSLRSMDHWISGQIPFDVKLSLSEGYEVSQILLEKYPRLRRYLPKQSGIL